MNHEPDLNFDIDALFKHLAENLDHDPEEEKEWSFSLRSTDFNALEQLADELEQEFMIQLQEEVEEYDTSGAMSLGSPMLAVIRRGALTVDDVKQVADRIQLIATERGFTYEGVNCYDPIDEEELYGWLAPEDAGWRLRHMTDCGLPEDGELPWVFLVMAPTLDSARQIAAALNERGFNDLDEYDEPDDEGDFALCVFVSGRNNEAELNESSAKISQAAELHGGELVGIQFYTREEVEEVFGLEEES